MSLLQGKRIVVPIRMGQEVRAGGLESAADCTCDPLARLLQLRAQGDEPV